MNETFRAVTAQEMKNILGRNCSPDPLRAGYVIGPDSNGNLCHIASCFYYNEAVQKALQCNANCILDAARPTYSKVTSIR